jgi:hypothetical protein
MKKSILLAVIFVMAVMVSAAGVYAAHDDVAVGTAYLHPENMSGVSGVITFVDDGSTLMVDGTAAGLDPNVTYRSLIYDNASLPGGPEACEPMIFNDDPGILNTMLIGDWINNNDGTGTLTAVNIVDQRTGERVYVSLDRFRTVSIRDTRINDGRGPEAVAACGWVADHPAGQ